jgi:fibronectin type 3 domain-containing protein
LASLSSACALEVEKLEDRRLFSTNTVQTLPFALEFNSDRGELLDGSNRGTGFTRVQANKLGNEYQQSRIDLDLAAGVLRLTTAGTSVAGSNTNGDNTLVNALETQFNATTSGFKITTRLVGPLSYIDIASEQGGIMFGPDQDNYVKLVAAYQNGAQCIQFSDEQTAGTTYTHALGFNTLASIGNFASVNTLDLQMVGDAAAGTVTAYYAVNGGAYVKINKTLTLTGDKKAAFFNSAGRAGLIALHKNDTGPVTVAFDRFSIDAGVPVLARPYVTATRPANGEIGVSRDRFVAADVYLPTPGAGIDNNTLNSTSVKLYRTSDKLAVGAVLNTSGGGDAIVLTPTVRLDANTTYTFEVTAGLKDTSGATFQPFSTTFTTGATGGETNASIAFEKVTLPTATGKTYTSVVVGPDGKLYAGTLDGIIQRFDINIDGTLGAATNITSLTAAEGGPRLLIGMVFDSSGNLWVSHSQYTDVTTSTADDWTGKISKLSGPNYSTCTTVIINLPRSVRDHMTNQMVFGPDGALYIAQASNTAMGAPDNAWGLRSEHLLNGAILRLDLSKVGSAPIDVKTDSGGTYNPFAVNAPLTLYATGVRNAYDLVWTSTGKLFAATNGSAAGGNTPATPSGSYSYGANERIDFSVNGAYTGPNVVGLTNVAQTQSDYIFQIVQGGYYGHPNPTRGEFVLNGGNPTAGVDPNEVPSYPVGTMPDRNYRGNNVGAASATQGSAYAFGLNYSPNGIIEYKSNALGGLMKGKLLVVEYSGGDEIAVLTTDANGNVTQRQNGIAGLTHFIDPLDLTENPATGFIYVAEYGGQKLTLVRPITPGANVSADKTQLVFNDATSSGAAPAQKITITNTGTSPLAFPADGLSIIGADAARFAITQKPTLPLSIAPGESIDVLVNFTANAVDVIRAASLQIKTNDPDTPIITIALRGIGTSGTGGLNEPSLQQILNLYQIPINVGDSTPDETNLDNPAVSPNDELIMSTLIKEGVGPVTIEPLSVFGVGDSNIPTFRFGYYTPGNKNDTTELLNVVGVSNSQSVNPFINGATSFDPGSGAFGLYAYWQKFTLTNGPTVYSEDRLNQTYDPASPRKVRFYALRTAAGAIVPNAYVFAFEEYNAGYDQQDFVGIIRNVKPAAAGAEIGFDNLDGVGFSQRLAFNRIQNPINTTVPNNIVHDTAVLRIRNTGSQQLEINSIVTSAGWVIDSAPAAPITILSGEYLDVTVRFVANPGGSTPKMLEGTLTVNSNDADEPAAVVSLGGHWQPMNENNKEPDLQQVFNLFGYKTTVAFPGQVLAQGGKVSRIGDEVLSGYWKRADGTLPVGVRQLVAYHTQGNTALAKWHNKGSNTTTTLFSHDPDQGQSILPNKDNGVVGSVDASLPAYGTFSPSGTFGFRLDNEWSDPTKNPQEQPGGYGHHVRFFAARDRGGKIIPNSYLMVMDYAGINYDYQDNVYLVTNIKPESGPSTPIDLAPTASGSGIALTWSDNTEVNLAGYNLYRATVEGGPFTKLNAALLSSSDLNDVNAPLNSTSYYYVTAVDTSGNESVASATVSAIRTSDSTAPDAPASFTANGASVGISLDWANNTESDLAGYNIYRSDSFGGTYVKLNSALLGSSDFFDSSAPTGAASYYRVTAVDTVGNESAASTANATRQSSDQTAPAVPSGLTGVGSDSGISLDWTNNSESDLAGYNIYRSASQFGTFVRLNGGLLGVSFFLDNAAPAGAMSYYRVTAVDTSGNESAAATVNAARPADATPPAQPSNVVVTATTSGIGIDWADNTESDLSGYNIFRSDSANGTFVKLNGSVLLSSNYFDTAAPQGTVSYYRIVAVDGTGNTSTNATASATRPIPDTMPPATPTGLSAVVGGSGITLDWADNIDSDLTGYNIYRSSSANGVFVKLNTNGVIAASTFLDAMAPAGTSYYRVTAVDTASNESSAALANATRIATYAQLDIGNPTPAGSMSTITEGSDYNLVAGGTDIFGAADSFSFGYTQVTGDFDYKVRLAGLSNTNAFTKAGLMARESLVAGSKNAFMLATPGANGYRFTYRTATSGSSTATGSGSVSYPNTWVRLVRAGNTFTGFRSVDGINWTQVGSMTIAMPGTLFFGMAATSHDAAKPATAQFRGLQNTAAAPVDQAPATPVGVTVTPSQSGIALDWTDNSESDLAGYDVYRSDSANGAFVKLNTAGLLTGSAFTDTTAPAGQTSYYRVVAVDAANLQSAPATASAARPASADTTPPAMPTGVVPSPSQSGISLVWSANSESDLAGYNVYRSNSANGTFVKLNTSGVLTAAAFNDTSAPAGAVSYYRITAVDITGNESTFAATSATRPNATISAIKINFQLGGSAAVSGYSQDNGAVLGDRGNGLTYGWNIDHSLLARDRNKISDQLLDTLVHMKAGASWSINVPNGTYTVKVGVGDAQYATTNTINVNGTNYWSAQALAIKQFADKTMTITVTNGTIVLDNGASADQTTRINYIEIIPGTPPPAVSQPAKINFQVAGSPAVAGYEQDNGLAYADRGNGLSYGWNGDYAGNARDRNKNANQLLDTLVHMSTGATWSIALANGSYNVTVSVGDSQYASTHDLSANGVTVFDNLNLAANQFQQKTVTVQVTDGKLTLSSDGANLATRLNYIEIAPA